MFFFVWANLSFSLIFHIFFLMKIISLAKEKKVLEMRLSRNDNDNVWRNPDFLFSILKKIGTTKLNGKKTKFKSFWSWKVHQKLFLANFHTIFSHLEIFSIIIIGNKVFHHKFRFCSLVGIHIIDEKERGKIILSSKKLNWTKLLKITMM